jgi:hypothetical protein
MNNLPIKVFPVEKEHTYDGVLTSFCAVGYGKTVAISQIEDQSLCIDLYAIEVNDIGELQGRKAIKSIELDRPMPTGDELQALAARYLAG